MTPAPFAKQKALLALLGGAPVPADPSEQRRILDLARNEGLGPLVAHTIRKQLAPAEQGFADQILVRSWAKYDQMLSEAESVVTVLAARSVRVVALKGPVLARRIWQPPFLRKPSGDLDFALADADLETACAALAETGYVLMQPLRTARTVSHHAVLTHRDQGARPRVELHFRLSHGTLGIPVEPRIADCRPHQLPGGAECLVLGEVDELLMLALHVLSGRFNPFFHLVEFHRLWTASAADVRAAVVRQATEHRLVGPFRMLDVALRVLWNQPLVPEGSPLPRTWLDFRINPDLLQGYERWAEDLRKTGLPGRTARNRMYGRWLDLHLTDTPAAAARLAREIALVAKRLEP
jgi:hypothetical protein